MSNLVPHQNNPIPNQSKAIWDLVIEDMKEIKLV